MKGYFVLFITCLILHASFFSSFSAAFEIPSCSYNTTSDSLDFSGIFGSAATGNKYFPLTGWKYYSPPQIYTFSGYPGNIIGSYNILESPLEELLDSEKPNELKNYLLNLTSRQIVNNIDFFLFSGHTYLGTGGFSIWGGEIPEEWFDDSCNDFTQDELEIIRHKEWLIEMYLCEPENGEMIPDWLCNALSYGTAIELRYNEEDNNGNIIPKCRKDISIFIDTSAFYQLSENRAAENAHIYFDGCQSSAIADRFGGTSSFEGNIIAAMGNDLFDLRTTVGRNGSLILRPHLELFFALLTGRANSWSFTEPFNFDMNLAENTWPINMSMELTNTLFERSHQRVADNPDWEPFLKSPEITFGNKRIEYGGDWRLITPLMPIDSYVFIGECGKGPEGAKGSKYYGPSTVIDEEYFPYVYFPDNPQPYKTLYTGIKDTYSVSGQAEELKGNKNLCLSGQLRFASLMEAAS